MTTRSWTYRFYVPHQCMLIALCLGFTAAAEPASHNDQKDFSSLELKSAVVGRSPLPFQAVRVRASLENHSKKTVGGIDLIGLDYPGIRAPGEENFCGIGFSVTQSPHADYLPPGSRPGGFMLTVQDSLLLKPGESETTVLPLPAGFGERPYFGIPGNHLLRAKYYPDPENHDPTEAIVSDTLTIIVHEPRDQEAAVHNLLRDKPGLAQEMMSACTSSKRLSDEATVRDLEQVVEKYAKTTYADYARFALARTYLGGVQKARSATAEKKAKALPLLEAIDLKAFPYASTVLLWIKIVRNSPENSARIEARLEEEFADDLTWLVAKRIPLAMSWLNEVLPTEQQWSAKHTRKPESTLYGDAEEIVDFIGSYAGTLTDGQLELLRKKVGRERGPRPASKSVQKR